MYFFCSILFYVGLSYFIPNLVYYDALYSCALYHIIFYILINVLFCYPSLLFSIMFYHVIFYAFYYM